MAGDGSASVVAASHRLASLSSIAAEVLPALAAASNACFSFLHHGGSCREPLAVTWPPAPEVLVSYQRDYAADCPFVPVKLASREWVLPITRRLSRKRLTKTAFYSDLLRPAGLEHHVELRLEPVRGNALPTSGIILCRDKRAGEFSDDDLSALAALRPVLTGASRRAAALDDALDRVAALEAMLALGGAAATRLAVNADGVEVHLQLAPNTNDGAMLAQLRDPAHPLRRLARDLARGVVVPDSVGATKVALTGDTRSYRADVALAPGGSDRPIALITLTPMDRWQLSRTESAVLAEIVAGRSNEEIGKRLFISPETVRTHLTRVYRKMGVRSRLEAAALARS